MQTLTTPLLKLIGRSRVAMYESDKLSDGQSRDGRQTLSNGAGQSCGPINRQTTDQLDRPPPKA